jgi:hypothetical protein
MAKVVTAKGPEVDTSYFIFKGYLHGRSFKRDTQGTFIGVYDPHVLMRSNFMICIVPGFPKFLLLDDVDHDYSCILELVSGAENHTKSLKRRAIFNKCSFFRVVLNSYICH